MIVVFISDIFKYFPNIFIISKNHLNILSRQELWMDKMLQTSVLFFANVIVVLLIAAHSAAVCHAQGVDPGHLGGTGHNAVLQRPRAGPPAPRPSRPSRSFRLFRPSRASRPSRPLRSLRSRPSPRVRHRWSSPDSALIPHVARSSGWSSSLPLPPPGHNHIHHWTFCRLFRGIICGQRARGTRDQVTTLKCWAQTASKTISLKPYDNDNVSVIPALLSFVSHKL